MFSEPRSCPRLIQRSMRNDGIIPSYKVKLHFSQRGMKDVYKRGRSYGKIQPSQGALIGRVSRMCTIFAPLRTASPKPPRIPTRRPLSRRKSLMRPPSGSPHLWSEVNLRDSTPSYTPSSGQANWSTTMLPWRKTSSPLTSFSGRNRSPMTTRDTPALAIARAQARHGAVVT